MPVPLIPIMFVELKVKRENNTYATLKTLLDSGASATLITSKAVRHLKKTSCEKTSFDCVAGSFSSRGKCHVRLKMAEFNPTATVNHNAHVTDTLGQYDMIIGRELLHELGIDLHFSTATMHWQNVEVSMKKPTCTIPETFHIAEELFVSEETDRIGKILDAKYAPADLTEITKNLPQLDQEQRKKLLKTLQSRKKLFDGTLGQWKGSPYKVELRDGVTAKAQQPAAAANKNNFLTAPNCSQPLIDTP